MSQLNFLYFPSSTHSLQLDAEKPTRDNQLPMTSTLNNE